ncbi:AraC family transcriptional regulator [Paenibacillus pasadenensis]|uniref:helix-turn-helix transcriptional regulator n=1 Tax=Paenibacillus pasadenensis TaxID=217090 RepID=UPI00204097A1|nr:AraC family transcriptional regulator [Paenibacillus pasadenensis]
MAKLYAPMLVKPDILDRMELSFNWGRYRLRVLRLHLDPFPRGYFIRFHKHSEYEFHFIAAGYGQVTLEEGEFDLTEGMFYLTGPGVMHQQLGGEDETMYELCLHIDINPLHGPFPDEEDWEALEARNCIETLDRLGAFPKHDRSMAMPWFLAAYQAVAEAQPGWATTVKQAVIQILLRASHAALDSPPAVRQLERDMASYRFQRVTQFIQDNYASPITLKEVAERIHVSSRQLQRIMKDQGGVSFSEYLERCRLDRVCTALAEGGSSIEQIATDNGFQSGNYLHYVFRRRFGMTPSRYRENSRSLPDWQHIHKE